MPRLLGVTIPDDKRSVISLTYVHGIGPATSRKVLQTLGIDENKRASELTPQELTKIRDLVGAEHLTEGELRRQTMLSIRRLRDIGSWRGVRHAKRLPVRGQRTRTNNRTIRGNKRVSAGSGRRQAASPT